MNKKLLICALVAMAAMSMTSCKKVMDTIKDKMGNATEEVVADSLVVEEVYDDADFLAEPDLLTGIAFYENVTVTLYEVEGSFEGTIIGDESGAEWEIDGYHYDSDDVRWTISFDGDEIGTMQLARDEYGFSGRMNFLDGDSCPVNLEY